MALSLITGLGPSCFDCARRVVLMREQARRKAWVSAQTQKAHGGMDSLATGVGCTWGRKKGTRKLELYYHRIVGMVLETIDGGAPKVHEIKSYGPLAGWVWVGDLLIVVDGKDITLWCAAALLCLIASKKYNPVQELITKGNTQTWLVGNDTHVVILSRTMSVAVPC